MKILLSSFDYPPRLGGVAKCSLELAKALQNTGAEIRVIAPGASEPDTSEFMVIRVKCSARPEFAIWKLLSAKRRIYKQWNPDCVLDVLWFPDGFVSYLLSFFYPEVKRGIIVHGVEILETKRNWKKRIRYHLRYWKEKIFRTADVIFPVSTYTRDLLIKETGSNIRFKQFRHGVNPKEYYPSVSDSTSGSELQLFTLTRLEDYKGIDNTLEALKILKNRGFPFRYRIGGEGPDQFRLETLIRSLELSDRVSLLGKIPQDQALREYQNCDAFILLSRIDLSTPNVEGFGLVYLEAALCGKPSLAPDIGGPTDAVIHNETGILVNPEDPQMIANSLEYFFDRAKTKRLGENARKRALTFSWQESAILIRRGFESCAE